MILLVVVKSNFRPSDYWCSTSRSDSYRTTRWPQMVAVTLYFCCKFSYFYCQVGSAPIYDIFYDWGIKSYVPYGAVRCVICYYDNPLALESNVWLKCRRLEFK